MKNKGSAARQQDDDPSLREHIKIVRLAAELMDRALRNSPVVSLDLAGNWKGFRRNVEDLISLVQIAR